MAHWKLEEGKFDTAALARAIEEGTLIDQTIKEYLALKRLELLPFQVTCVKRTLNVALIRNVCAIIEIPTGSGKSLIISALAQAILKLLPGIKILVVLPTAFLKYVAYTNYSFGNNTEQMYPALAGNRNITYVEADVFAELREDTIANRVILVDEIEQCFVEKQFKFVPRQEDKKPVARFIGKKLARARTVIGMTGTYHEVSKQRL